MLSTHSYSLVIVLSITVFTNVHVDSFSEYHKKQIYPRHWDSFRTGNEISAFSTPEAVKVQLYYECMCPFCRKFDTKQLAPLVRKLGPYVNVKTIPYGNARTIIGNDGKVTFHCQHGPAECYGNKLHACAIDLIGNMTTAILFNTCMMDESQQNRGSDDAAADNCGQSMQIDTSQIKQCAKSPKGDDLLKHNGELTEKLHIDGVPYVVINGKELKSDNLMKAVCSVFKDPPSACRQQWPQM